MTMRGTMRKGRTFKGSFLAACAALGLAMIGWAGEQPNIVFILSDDQGWNDIGYHNPEIKTPNLDRLAAEGVRLDAHYVYPTCSPTRVALLTGRTPSRFGVLGPLGTTTEVPSEAATLVHALRRQGYSTHISGKWHIGDRPEFRPLRYGFQTSYGYLRGQIDPYTHVYKFGDYRTWHRNDELLEERGHATDLITEEAIRVIESAGPEPFFLYVAYSVPHFPLNEHAKWVAPYYGVFDDVWRRIFAASLTHMDDGIGQIAAALERTGQRENTLIIFASDNGGQESWSAPEKEYDGRYPPHSQLGDNAPLRGWKGTLYEGGIRVPAFANWPGGLGPEGLAASPTHIMDWAPTLIRLAGGQIREEWGLEGRDIGPLLSGEKNDGESRTFYWNHGGRVWAVRHGPWKLIQHQAGGRVELFQVEADPSEEDNLAGDRSDVVEKLMGILADYKEKDL